MYTGILLIFGGFNMQSRENSMSFVASKPDIMIVNQDEEKGITQDFIKYITENSNIIKLENDKDKINDALFYREVNYVIYIPKDYHTDFMNGKNPEIKVKTTGDYQASYAEMLVERYIKTATTYRNHSFNEKEIIDQVGETLAKKTEVEITSKLDTTALEKAAFYFNFESYSLLACLIFIICMILSSFNNVNIRKRTIISSTDYRKNNRILLLSNCLYSLVVWLFYLILSFVLLGNVMFTAHGVIYMINSLIFTMCATTLAFLVSNLVSNKNAINGIVNVIALGSSFLCGAFVPQTWLPTFVLKIAHLLPTYYYIKVNDSLTTLETFSMETLKPLLINMGIIVIFSVVFMIITNIIVSRKQKID